MTKWSLPASTMLARSGVSPLAWTGAGRIASEGEASVADNVRAMKMTVSRAAVRLRRMLVPLGDVARVCRRDSNPADTPVGITRTDYMTRAPHVLGQESRPVL